MRLSSLKFCLLLSLLGHVVGFAAFKYLIPKSVAHRTSRLAPPPVVASPAVTFVLDSATDIPAPRPVLKSAPKKLDQKTLKLFAVDDFAAAKKLPLPREIKIAKNKNEPGALSRGETVAVNQMPPAASPTNDVVVAKISRVFATANVQPDYLKNPKPDYPPAARRQHQEGTVLFRVHVTARGRPDRIELLQSSGVSALDESALRAVRGWEFTPAQMGEAEVESEIDFPIQFKLE